MFITKKRQKIKLRKRDLEERKILFLKFFRKFIILAILVVILIIFSSFMKNYLVKKGFFDIKTVKIKSVNKIYEVYNKRILDDLSFSIGKDIFSFDSKLEQEKILKRFRDIEQVSIKKYYTSRIIVKTKFRTPLFFINTNKGKFFLDKSGVVFRSDNGQQKVIEIEPAVLIQTKRQKFFNLVSFVSLLKEKDVRFLDAIKKIDIMDDFVISIYLYSGKKIVWGVFDRKYLNTKLKFFYTVLNDLKKKNMNFESIDLKNFRNMNDFVVVK